MNFFYISKPLQYLVFLSIIEDMNLKNKDIILMVNGAFYDSDCITNKISTYSEFPVNYFNGYFGFIGLILSSNTKRLFLDSDVGFKKFIFLLILKAFKRNLQIYVYEEGTGTYKKSFYRGIKKLFFKKIGVGTHFGACKFTDGIFCYDKKLFTTIFGNDINVHQINVSLASSIKKNNRLLFQIFDSKAIIFEQNTNNACLYLSDWDFNYSILKKVNIHTEHFYFKLHPHNNNFIKIENAICIENSYPAEMLIVKLCENYCKVKVFHHDCSVERYIEFDNLTYVNLNK